MIDFEEVLVFDAAGKTDACAAQGRFANAVRKNRRLLANVRADDKDCFLIFQFGNTATEPWKRRVIILIGEVTPLQAMIDIRGAEVIGKAR